MASVPVTEARQPGLIAVVLPRTKKRKGKTRGGGGGEGRVHVRKTMASELARGGMAREGRELIAAAALGKRAPEKSISPAKVQDCEALALSRQQQQEKPGATNHTKQVHQRTWCFCSHARA